VSGIFPLLSIPPAASEALAAAQLELQRLRTQMRARDAYLRELEHALATSTRQLSAAGLESPEDVARLLGRVRGQAFRIAELESEVRSLTTSLAERRNTFRPSEELQRVRGIGRRFAEQLGELGFGSLRRIAACTDADVALIAKRLRITRERVVRERWVEQASLLIDKSDGVSAELEA
jgi:predicted flap endonuclease-1-like 5' DNA nuclease